MAMLGSRFGRRGGGGGRGAASCPQADGTQIGLTQQFTVVCGAAVDGDIIEKTTATSLLDCTKQCTDSQQRCDAVTFADGRNNKRDGYHRRDDGGGNPCFLKTNITQPEENGPSGVDTAIAIFSNSSSNCAGLGASTSQGGTSFGLFCSNVLPGNDLSRGFASTFQDCMNQCSSTNGCAGLTFDAGHVTGFKNCHLKTSGVGNGSSKIAGSGFDSAIVQKAQAVADQNVAAVSASSAEGSNTSSSITTAAPLPPPVILSSLTSIASIVSLSAESTEAESSIVTAIAESAAPATIVAISIQTIVTTIVSSVDGLPQDMTLTEQVPVVQGTVFSAADSVATTTSTTSAAFTPGQGFGGFGNGNGNGNRNDNDNDNGRFGGFNAFVPAHPAVVAAPVIGGMIAVIILVLLCVMRRKHQQRVRNTRLLVMSKIASNGNTASDDTDSESASVAKGMGAARRTTVPIKLETWSWLPGMWSRRSGRADRPSIYFPEAYQNKEMGEALEYPVESFIARQAREGQESQVGTSRMERLRGWTTSWRDRLRTGRSERADSTVPDAKEIGSWTAAAGAGRDARDVAIGLQSPAETPVLVLRDGRIAKRGFDGGFA
jgi:hypothetical protein